MYAVIKTGGKQYKVVAGEKLKIEQIPADIGSEITLDQVLAMGAGETVTFGEPLIAGATVLATVLAHGRHDKVKIFKMRRRKHYQKHQGHRQFGDDKHGLHTMTAPTHTSATFFESFMHVWLRHLERRHHAKQNARQ